MDNITYETTSGNAKTLTGEWIDTGPDLNRIFKTEDNRYLEVFGSGKVTTIVRTRNGGKTERTLGYIA